MQSGIGINNQSNGVVFLVELASPVPKPDVHRLLRILIPPPKKSSSSLVVNLNKDFI